MSVSRRLALDLHLLHHLLQLLRQARVVPERNHISLGSTFDVHLRFAQRLHFMTVLVCCPSYSYSHSYAFTLCAVVPPNWRAKLAKTGNVAFCTASGQSSMFLSSNYRSRQVSKEGLCPPVVVVGTSAQFEAREWTGRRRSHSWFGFHSPPLSPTSSHLLSWLPLFCDLGCAATGVLVVLSFFETKQQQLNTSSFVAIGSYTSLNLPD